MPILQFRCYPTRPLKMSLWKSHVMWLSEALNVYECRATALKNYKNYDIL